MKSEVRVFLMFTVALGCAIVAQGASRKHSVLATSEFKSRENAREDPKVTNGTVSRGKRGLVSAAVCGNRRCIVPMCRIDKTYPNFEYSWVPKGFYLSAPSTSPVDEFGIELCQIYYSEDVYYTYTLRNVYYVNSLYDLAEALDSCKKNPGAQGIMGFHDLSNEPIDCYDPECNALMSMDSSGSQFFYFVDVFVEEQLVIYGDVYTTPNLELTNKMRYGRLSLDYMKGLVKEQLNPLC